MKDVIILTGGELCEDLFWQVFHDYPERRIICVDGALDKAYKWHVPVDVILGDFDTVSGETLARYENGEVKESPHALIVRHSPEKDMTDTHLAIQWAVGQDKKPCMTAQSCQNAEPQQNQIIVLGATGSRLDHVIGNLHAMYECRTQGTDIFFLDETCRISIVTDPKAILKEEAYGKYLSILPFSKTAKGVTLSGVKYPVENRDFAYGESIGVSNEIVSERALIQVEEGVLLVIESKDA